ncbi:hypothetical protein BC777_0987 [Yoonia maricola]|uniref:DUF7742 domain-containing protein n=1 Tax=Yoonia maricola TaxID=420999 RepID=A0A2M8WMK6_9RHOB|nr:hypothetical protein [Yoonia maricola]PJI92143.1 hypothetical protein BC777_0987 [Yoonia maricola]
MRPVQLADIEMAARVLMGVAPAARDAVMRDMIIQAQTADAYRRFHGKPHPRFGSGAVLSCAARQDPVPRPAALGLDALAAYAIVIQTLLADASYQSS